MERIGSGKCNNQLAQIVGCRDSILLWFLLTVFHRLDVVRWVADHLYERVHVGRTVGHIDRQEADKDLAVDDTVMGSQQVPEVLNQVEHQPHLVSLIEPLHQEFPVFPTKWVNKNIG